MVECHSATITSVELQQWKEVLKQAGSVQKSTNCLKYDHTDLQRIIENMNKCIFERKIPSIKMDNYAAVDAEIERKYNNKGKCHITEAKNPNLKFKIKSMQDKVHSKIQLNKDITHFLKNTEERLVSQNKNPTEKFHDRKDKEKTLFREYKKVIRDCLKELMEDHQSALEEKNKYIMSLGIIISKLTKQNEMAKDEICEREQEVSKLRAENTDTLILLKKEHQCVLNLKMRILKDFKAKIIFTPKKERFTSELCGREYQGNVSMTEYKEIGVFAKNQVSHSFHSY